MKRTFQEIDGKSYWVYTKEEGVNYDYFKIHKTKYGNELILNVPNFMLSDLESLKCLDIYINEVKQELEEKIKHLKDTK